MTDQPQEIQVVQPQPVPNTVKVTKVGTRTLETGDQVALLRIEIYHVAGVAVVFWTAPEAIGIADLLRQISGGLTIASDLGGITPP